MREADFKPFAAMLDDVAALLMRPGQPALTPTARAMYFRALAAHSIDDVRAALDAHVRDPQRGRFFPMPADVLAQLEGMATEDGRPGAEEAWAIAMRTRDEAETVVWTHEIAAALDIARPVLAAGDEVGARMSFREAYTRIVDEARRQRMPVAWSASLGFDRERRDKVLAGAVAEGRLPTHYLPAPATQGVPLLQLANSPTCPPQTREALLALSERLKQGAMQRETVDAAARRETEAAKQRTAEQVAEYERQHGLSRAEQQLQAEGEEQQP